MFLSMRSRSQSGFTLVEVLIAVFIFAILAVIATMGLRNVLNTRNRLKVVDKQLLQLNLSETFLRRDLSQVIDRSITNANGGQSPAIAASGQGIVFTRTGVLNPNHRPRSNMMRVAYSINSKNQLVRTTWPVLDQAPTTTSLDRVLLDGVSGFTVEFIDQNGRRSNQWMVSTDSSGGERHADLPAGVLITMMVKGLGKWQMAYPIPAKGFKVVDPHA